MNEYFRLLRKLLDMAFQIIDSGNVDVEPSETVARDMRYER
jgi:hypothetical protein